jgi:RNA polymerase sigma-70 factor (ECF subfamily)
MTNVEFNSTLLGMRPKLMRFAMSLTHDREKTPDLVQDTYLKALMSRNNFADFTNLKAWVFTIMKNTFINNYRRNMREHFIIDYTQDLFYLNQPHDKGFISPESKYSEDEISGFIDSLSEEFRVPFRMLLEGYKYKEISDKLGLKIGTVKSRIFLSRQKLMAQLKDYSG